MKCIDGSWSRVITCKPGAIKVGTNITILIKDKLDIHISEFFYNVNNDTEKVNDTVTTERFDDEIDSKIDEVFWRFGNNN